MNTSPARYFWYYYSRDTVGRLWAEYDPRHDRPTQGRHELFGHECLCKHSQGWSCHIAYQCTIIRNKRYDLYHIEQSEQPGDLFPGSSDQLHGHFVAATAHPDHIDLMCLVA